MPLACGSSKAVCCTRKAQRFNILLTKQPRDLTLDASDLYLTLLR